MNGTFEIEQTRLSFGRAPDLCLYLWLVLNISFTQQDENFTSDEYFLEFSDIMNIIFSFLKF